MITTQKTRAKILDLDALATQLEALKGAGEKIVLSHGVFDLLHIGHIRHFEQAKTFGDVLVVTLTEDHHVNKGPHRPAFGQSLRAESIAALECVDYVAVNRWPTAEKTIGLLKPDVYAKGPDYKDKAKDVTGGIGPEEQSVRRVGGKLICTDDVTYSSSNLLNRHVPQFEPEVERFLDAYRKRRGADDIAAGIEALKKLKVLVIGEAILDEYVYCSALGKSSKEPILAMQYASREIHAGGALAIANHVAEFTAQVDLVTYLGDRNSQEELIRASLKPQVNPTFIHKKDSPTIVKRRFVDKYLVQKLFEIYEMNDAVIAGEAEEELCAWLGGHLEQYDCVIAADFGHGLLSTKAAALLTDKARFLCLNTQINAANIGYHTVSKYSRADYVCIQEGEVRLDSRDKITNLRELVTRLSRKLACPRVMVTRGKSGTLLHVDGEFDACPSFAVKVLDRIGAGDAVLSVTSLAVAAGLPQDVISFIGNIAGAEAVTIVGNRASISRIAILKSIQSLLK